MFSGGLASWAAAKRTLGPKVLLFCDTLIEDADLYRFLDEAASDLGAPLHRIADGRTPWGVFDDVKFLGNNRVAPCSRVLKQEQARAWMTQHDPVHKTTIVLGYDWTEFHRVEAARKGWAPWHIRAPLTEPPYLTRTDMANELATAGIALPRLYRLGFPHNNCGGGCVRAGHDHWRHVLRAAPEVYDEWERQEERQRERLGDVAILRHRSGPKVGEPLPLAEFRTLQETDQLGFGWGGCGCFDG
jgi:hypothetical protein